MTKPVSMSFITTWQLLILTCILSSTHFVTAMSSVVIVNLTGLKKLLWRQNRVLVSYYTRLRETRGIERRILVPIQILYQNSLILGSNRWLPLSNKSFTSNLAISWWTSVSFMNISLVLFILQPIKHLNFFLTHSAFSSSLWLQVLKFGDFYPLRFENDDNSKKIFEFNRKLRKPNMIFQYSVLRENDKFGFLITRILLCDHLQPGPSRRGGVARVVTRGPGPFGTRKDICYEFFLCFQYSSRNVSRPTGILSVVLTHEIKRFGIKNWSVGRKP